MAIYDIVKDAIGVAQKADNIDIYKKLLDIGQKALDLQNENAELKKKIECLTRVKQFEEDIVRHKEPYYTLKVMAKAREFVIVPHASVKRIKEYR